MMERAAGYSDDCCMSFGNENFGKMVEIAGGINMAAKIIPGTFGVVNPEQIIAANPDQVIVTGSNWELYVPGGALGRRRLRRRQGEGPEQARRR